MGKQCLYLDVWFNSISCYINVVLSSASVTEIPLHDTQVVYCRITKYRIPYQNMFRLCRNQSWLLRLAIRVTTCRTVHCSVTIRMLKFWPDAHRNYVYNSREIDNLAKSRNFTQAETERRILLGMVLHSLKTIATSPLGKICPVR